MNFADVAAAELRFKRAVPVLRRQKLWVQNLDTMRRRPAESIIASSGAPTATAVGCAPSACPTGKAPDAGSGPIPHVAASTAAGAVPPSRKLATLDWSETGFTCQVLGVWLYPVWWHACSNDEFIEGINSVDGVSLSQETPLLHSRVLSDDS